MDNEKSLVKIFAIFDFDEHLVCSPCVLGAREKIEIGGLVGYIEFPSLPVLPSKDHIGTFLIPPKEAKSWKRGDELITWGRVATEPLGVSRVDRILFEFEVEEQDLESSAKCIYDGFSQWQSLFNEYLECICESRYEDSLEIIGGLKGVNLLVWNGSNSRSPVKAAQTIICTTILNELSGFTKNQLQTICAYCNSLKAPPLEYRLQNEAYRALRQKDYRKAIIETAAAAELAFTNAVKPILISSGQDVVEVLNKNRMLGNRYKLVTQLGIVLPSHDYRKLLIDPRNDVIHAADFADEKVAQTAVNIVDEILNLLVAI
jgi:hypothetical protein